MRAFAAVAGALLVSAACLGGTGCGGGDRDVVPATHDVVEVNGAAGSGSGNGASGASGDGASASADRDGGAGVEGYQHVAKRRHGVVALAEGRGFVAGQAERAIDLLADAFETCASEREKEGKLVAGAVRVVVRVNAAGEIDGLNVRTAPGAPVASNVLLCIIAPLKAETFGPGAARGMAIESEWQPQGMPPSTPGQPPR